MECVSGGDGGVSMVCADGTGYVSSVGLDIMGWGWRFVVRCVDWWLVGGRCLVSMAIVCGKEKQGLSVSFSSPKRVVGMCGGERRGNLLVNPSSPGLTCVGMVWGRGQGW